MPSPLYMQEEAPRPKARPARLAIVAIKAAAQVGMEVEIRPDGTITIRPAKSPQSTAPAVAPKEDIRLQAENKRLREALEPFANSQLVTASDFARARAALSPAP